jgi:PAS domain S-box-containing protein
MNDADETTGKVTTLLATPDLAGALESEQFRRFLDQVPIAIAVSDMSGHERIVYANPEFERLSGRLAADLVDTSWSLFQDEGRNAGAPAILGDAITRASDFIGTYTIERPGEPLCVVDAYSNIIEDDEGRPAYRLAALVDVSAHEEGDRETFEQKLREKDTLLLEVQHRVKNNLQMITALMRIEARNARGKMDAAPFHRLAGRIESIQILYGLLSDHGGEDVIDLGVYLSRVASAVLQAHAVEGIRLDLKVDVYPVSVNVAMPTGLVVNELLTNALKHAFAGRPAGTITLHSLTDAEGCRITIADDGVGLPEGATWPKRGKLGSAIVQSLRENAKADLDVESRPGDGVRVTIVFKRSNSRPVAAVAGRPMPGHLTT